MNDGNKAASSRENRYRRAILGDAATLYEVNLTKDAFIGECMRVVDNEVRNLFEVLEVEPFEKYSDYISFCAGTIGVARVEEYKKFFDVQRLIQCYERGETQQTFDSWVVDATGEKCLHHYTLYLEEDEDTGDIIALSVTKDVTKQVEKQKLLKVTLSQMKSADRTKDKFLSNMSHDIRTPLNAIIGYAELIQNHISQPDKVAEYNEKIHIFGDRMLSIMNDFLEVSRMESGRIDLNEVECNLSDILKDIERSAALAAQESSLHFRADYSQVEHFAIIADYIRMKEILCQLIDNAVKYTNPDGNISLTVIEEKLDVPGYGSYKFIIEDDGVGISPEFMDNLFDPFTQENAAAGGSGLGLTVVKNLLDAMDGKMMTESVPGEGTKFEVTLLLKLQKEQNIRQEIRTLIDKEELKGKKILLVEDNVVSLEITQELLSAQGYLVETAQNGSQALEMIKDSSSGYYDLILMDIQMPVMDGYEATKAIRQLENEKLAQIPIIALSANVFAEDYHKSMEAGMDGHTPKPIEMRSLQEAIRTVLSQRGWRES